MSETSMDQTSEIPIESILRDELAQGDTVLGTIAPILGHLVINAESSLFSDEIVAHIRGMANSVAAQLLSEQAKAAGDEDTDIDSHLLSRELLANNGFLLHCHALAVERSFADRLEQRNSIDPVLSPMLQALISSSEADISSAAMAMLAAQARFIQQFRRMELPLTELPGDLFHDVVLMWRTAVGEETEEVIAQTELELRARYDEATSRLGLLSRLVSGMGSGARAALSVSHSGAAIFLSGLAYLSKQPRDIAVLSTNERQLGRLALSLRAAGLKPGEVEEQFLLIHPEIALPEGFEMLRSDLAAKMLAASSGSAG